MSDVVILRKWFREHQEGLLEDFFDFLRIPSISAEMPYVKESERCASWVCDYLNKMGLKSSIIGTPKSPVVFAENEQMSNRPTLLIYGHYDVQPVEPLQDWSSNPFEPVLKDGKVYARGSSDDKGQVFYIMAAIRALLEMDKELPINLKVCFEGDEESGSLGLMSILADVKEQFKSDFLLTCDLGLPNKDTPAITLGARGIVYFTLNFKSAKNDLHSGEHGGIALSSLRAAVATLAQIWDKKGKVTIPGFYDDVKKLSKKQLSELYLDFDQKQYSEQFGVEAFAAEQNVPLRVANWLRPTVEINGIGGGYFGSGEKTIIPAQTTVKMSCRLVPDQDPEDIVKKVSAFLKEKVPSGIKLEIQVGSAGKPFRHFGKGGFTNAVTGAYEEVFQKKCQKIMAGGSVHVSGVLSEVLNCENIMMGVGLAEDNIHAPDENLSVDRLEKGFCVIATIITRLKKDVEKVRS